MLSQKESHRRIQRLSDVIIDRIAAGEVVEGPHSIVKELVENSLDAGAASIVISTQGAGMDTIVIEDDGQGIRFDDLGLTIERYATSKIETLEDVSRIHSFGFRGEALAAISSVSHLEIKTKHRDESAGGYLVARGGELLQLEGLAHPGGTLIIVRELFYSVPARKKFLKSERKVNADILHQIYRLSLANPGVAFSYNRDGKQLLNLLPVADPLLRLEDLFHRNMSEKMLSVEAEAQGIHIGGYVSDHRLHRSNREGQFFFVNGRAVEFKNAPFMIRRLYAEIIPQGTFPFFLFNIDVDPERIDVNVHPAKREIRFLDEQLFHAMLYRAVEEALRRTSPLPVNLAEASKGAKAGGYQFSSGDTSSRRKNAESVHSKDLSYGSGSVAVPANVKSSKESLTSIDEFFQDTPIIEKSRFEPVTLSVHEENASQKKPFLPRRVLGVALGTYVIAEGNDGIFLIDQHAAHERIHYERIRKELEERKGERQLLLHPVVIKVLPHEMDEWLENAPILEEHGFVVDAAGRDDLAIREIPFFMDAGTEESQIARLLERIREGNDDYRIFEEYAAMKACKSSIKKNDSVSLEVIAELLQQLSRCEDPSRCPHGRPTMVFLSRTQIDQMFLRIV